MAYGAAWLGRLRPYAALSLAAIGISYLWMFVGIFKFWGAPLWPDENTVLFNWLIFVVFTLFILNPLLGFWLVSRAYWRGGGRLGWRWWVGRPPGCGFLLSGGAQVISGLVRHEVPVGAHPWMRMVLAFAAILPLWIVASPKAHKSSGFVLDNRARFCDDFPTVQRCARGCGLSAGRF